MKSRYKIAAFGGLAAVSGAVACWKWMIRMPLKEFTRYALYMAAMDDETCRNELEGNQIGDEVIKFPPIRLWVRRTAMEMRRHQWRQPANCLDQASTSLIRNSFVP